MSTHYQLTHSLQYLFLLPFVGTILTDILRFSLQGKKQQTNKHLVKQTMSRDRYVTGYHNIHALLHDLFLFTFLFLKKPSVNFIDHVV